MLRVDGAVKIVDNFAVDGTRESWWF